MVGENSSEQLPPAARHVLISVNPRAGARPGTGKIGRLVELLAENGLLPEVFRSLDEVAARGAELVRAGELRALVAAGGDGTVAELVNRTCPRTPIAILPLGTENLLARHIGLDPSPQGVCHVVKEGRTLQLDAGLAGKRLFMMVLGVGFDAEVVRRVDEGRQGHITHWTWIKPIWDSVRKYRYPELKLTWTASANENSAKNVAAWEGSATARWVFVVNMPRYARGLQIAPAAVGIDGLLDVCTFRGGSFWSGLKYVLHVALRRHQRLADCAMFRAARLRIEADEPVPYQLDGDAGGWLPVDVEVLRGRVKLLVPADYDPGGDSNRD